MEKKARNVHCMLRVKRPVHNPAYPRLLKYYRTFIVGVNSTSITSASEDISHRFNFSDEHFPNSFWPVTSWNAGAAVAPLVVLPLMEGVGVRTGYLVGFNANLGTR